MAALEHHHLDLSKYDKPIDVAAFEDHELEAKADEIENEAEQLRAISRALFSQAAVLRSRAERARQDMARKGARDGRRKKAAQPFDPNDSLIAAAALATEDLPPGFTAQQLAMALDVGTPRATRLLLALEHRGLVIRWGQGVDGWNAVDPELVAFRDAARQLGTFTQEQLAAKIGRPAEALTGYVVDAKNDGWIEGNGTMTFVKPDPNQGPHSRPTHRPPEKEPPAGVDAPRRGEPVRIVDHGKRANTMNRHREKQRDRRHQEMQDARASRSERDKAKSAANRSGKSKSRRRK